MKDEWLETLNLMGQGDISKEYYDNIVKLCIRRSHGSTQTKFGIRYPLSRTSKIACRGVTRAENGNLLEYFKTDILSRITTQLDILQVKQNQVEGEQSLSIFCLRYRKRHENRECPLDMIETCAIFTKDHPK